VFNSTQKHHSNIDVVCLTTHIKFIVFGLTHLAIDTTNYHITTKIVSSNPAQARCTFSKFLHQ